MIRFLALIILSLVVLPAPFHAQEVPQQEEPKAVWSTYGIVVNDTPGNTPQQNPQILNDGYGGYIIVWEDSRSGFCDIYAQRIDEAGRLLWGKDGIAACDFDGNQNFPQATGDGAGGIIVVWQDYRDGNSDIFAQRISYNGSLLWDKNGKKICGASAGQFAPQIISDGSGGVIITWHDYRSGTGEDVYAQRIEGNGKCLWQENGIAISAASGTQWYPKITSDGSGGAIIVWTDGRESSSDNNIYAQRIDPAGKVLWEKDGIPICSAPYNQESPTIIYSPQAPDQKGSEQGAIIAWNDSRAKNIDIYAQKIDLNGNIKWKKDGLAASAFPYSQEDMQLSLDGSGGAIIVWTDQRTEKSDIYAQRISSDGRIAWAENGQPICKAPGEQKKPIITKLINEGWIIIWEDEQKGKTKTDLFAQKINSTGISLWNSRGIPIASACEMQKSASAVSTPKGNIVVAWEDSRFGNYDIYSQKISTDGSLLWKKSGLTVCAAKGSVVQQNLELVANDKGEIILVFEDARSGYFNIYAQKITKNGALAWGRDGIAIAKVAANQAKPRIVWDGVGGVIVAWEDHRIEDFPAIRLQHINSQGRRLWESSIPAATVRSQQTNPLMIPDGAGGAIIIWEDGRDVLSLQDIYAQRVSDKGELLWGKKGKIVISENGEQVDADMISDGVGGAILAWTDYRHGERNPNIYAQRINSNGKILWREDGVLVCSAPDVQRAPKIIADDEEGAIICWTDKGGGSYDIYAQRINKAGQPTWITDGIPINQVSRTQQNAKFGNKNILVWEDYRYGNWDIFSASVSPVGKLLWDENGVPVVHTPYTQYSPQITTWTNDSVIIAWEDYRSSKQYEIYIQRLDSSGKAIWQDNGIKVESKDGGRIPKILATPSDDSFYVFWEDYTDGGRAIYSQRFLLY